MDPETALELVKHGVTLLLLDVPQYTLVAVDTQMFSVGPAFKGIKMIPPGVHFVYYSSSSRDGKEFSSIIGFFIDAGPSEVIVRKWDQQEERLIKLSEEEEERYSQAVKNLEFDRQLGPYNLSHYEDWKQLSNFITKSVIERLEPIGGEITVECENEIVRNATKMPMEDALGKQLKVGNSATSVGKSQRKGCYYTSIPHVVKCKGISGQELTSLNLDKTQLLETLLAKDYGGSEDLLLGELQFAFVAFLMGQSLEAFLQWKSLVSLLFGCTEAGLGYVAYGYKTLIDYAKISSVGLPFRTRTHLFTKFIKVIYNQLKYGLQKDHMGETGSALLDDSWISADSFLHHLCKDFFSSLLDGSVVDGDLLKWTRKFKELLERNLGWEFQQSSAVDGMYFEENDEYAPVVEMLDDEAPVV
ncbi:Protein AAR2 [Glycine max]|nr:Protein AAR2 [Glycine max]KAH1211983.1 Protein AAR2 [Glycine max]